MLQYAFAPNARSYGCLVIDASRACCSERGEGGVGERSPVALPILIALTQSAATRRLCGAAAIIAYFAALIFNLKLLSDIGAAGDAFNRQTAMQFKINADIQRE